MHESDDTVRDDSGQSRRTFMKATGAATVAGAIGVGADSVVAQGQTINELLSEMTVAEKAGQMMQPAIGSFDTTTEDPFAQVDTIGDLFSELGTGSVLAGGSSPPTLYPEELVASINDLQEYNIENSPHGIPFFFGIDGVHGAAYVDGATALPQRINMGATRDPELIEDAEEHTSDVIAATGCHETFAPTIELQRDPRWGRFFEGISESSKVLADISRARNRALETNDRVTATPKHFAGYEVPANGNDRAAANTSMRDLRETLLPPFEVTLEEGGGMVMVNSGSVNGVPAHASHWLLTTFLREEYGFEGVTLSDWNDLYRMIDIHEMFPDNEDGKRMAVETAIEAGVDMVMLGGGGVSPAQFVTFVEELVEGGDLSEDRIDEAVRRILELKRDLGLFEDPYTDESRVTDLVGNDESVRTSTQLARESMVLLKNESVTEGGEPALPLSGDENLLVTGPGVNPNGLENRILMQHGGWTLGWQGIEGGGLSEDGPRPAGKTMMDVLEERLSSEQLTHVPTTFDRSQWWAQPSLTDHEQAEPTEDWRYPAYQFTDEQRSAVEDAAPDADAVVVVVGEAPHNEGFGDRDYLRLPETQREIVRTVVENTSDDTPIIGVEYAGSPRGGQRTFQHMDAVLFAGQPATGGGTAVVETLLGEHNPSGRLSFSWPREVGDISVAHNSWPGNLDDPLYPYGHGLSYTTFEYSSLSVTPPTVGKPTPESDRPVRVSVDVTNTGDVAGDHIVEVYNTQSYGSVMHRDRRVVGYERAATIEPGETRTVEVDIDLAALEVIPGDVPGFGPRAIEAGEYELTVGDLTTTLTVENAGRVTSARHVPGRFDIDGDGELTVSDVMDIYRLIEGRERGRGNASEKSRGTGREGRSR
ncbi:glycoside hydrolase family 3 protein [Halapricum desulfuricans]|uniref:beta-glucosidase n=1 Tax=Halapricum desulfuricans TaxID=2841257 RepID=A0A897NLS7_9EURY|nr:glycoside hydrolase family 3 N-terminal domain-containing protein [Halapricum desulfuricans]QSG13648.1 Bifunctional b-D-xylosidase/a-L-arabinosidase orrelated glycosidase [Halapricum desulfuricans]